MGCKLKIHLSLERLNAVALTDEPPDHRFGQAKPEGAFLDGETLIEECRANFLLEVRSKRDAEDGLVAIVLSRIK